MFFVWDGNHHLQTWLLYIDMIHLDDYTLHILVDAIVLGTTDGLVELLIVMTNLNKFANHHFPLLFYLVLVKKIERLNWVDASLLNMITFLQTWFMITSRSKVLERFPWCSLKVCSQQKFIRNVKPSFERLGTP
jgi:hypothetical protein